jgi:Phospholipase_D-nuclease N-terminal
MPRAYGECHTWLMNETTILLLILPIVILEIALIVFALRDLVRPERRVRGDSKLLWGIVIVLFQIIGPILYFVVGRETE